MCCRPSTWSPSPAPSSAEASLRAFCCPWSPVRVEHDRDMTGLALEERDPRRPLRQLGVRVPPVEPFARVGDLCLPHGGVATVKPQVRAGPGDVDYRRHARWEALRLVDCDVDEPALSKEPRRLFESAGEPGLVAELDGDLVVGQPRLALVQVLVDAAGRRDPRRELEQDGADLAGRVHRPQRLVEPLPQRVLGVGGNVLEIHVAARVRMRRDRLAQVPRQRLDVRPVPREQPERLHVEAEPFRGPLAPRRRVLDRRDGVVGGVHLDRWEDARIEPQPGLGGLHVLWVEEARTGERLVRPGTRAYPD